MASCMHMPPGGGSPYSSPPQPSLPPQVEGWGKCRGWTDW